MKMYMFKNEKVVYMVVAPSIFQTAEFLSTIVKNTSERDFLSLMGHGQDPLQGENIAIEVTRYPTGHPVAEEIRVINVDLDDPNLCPFSFVNSIYTGKPIKTWLLVPDLPYIWHTRKGEAVKVWKTSINIEED